jgi:hypothetical protein
MARYQQGIGIKEAGDSQSTFQAPTMWQEPKAPPINKIDFKPTNTGAQRNYGSTPQYVDTWKSRWEHGENNALIGPATNRYAQNQANTVRQNRANSRRGTDTGPATNPAWSATQRQRRATYE